MRAVAAAWPGSRLFVYCAMKALSACSEAISCRASVGALIEAPELAPRPLASPHVKR